MKVLNCVKGVAAAVVLSVSSFSFAAVDLGDLAPGDSETFSVFEGNGSNFDGHEFTFTLTDTSNVQISLSNLVITDNVPNGLGGFTSVALFNSDVEASLSAMSFIGNIPGDVSVDFLGLAPTDYTLVLGGPAFGAIGGIAQGEIEVSAVPLPAAAWLFASGLFGLGVIGRKRRAS